MFKSCVVLRDSDYPGSGRVQLLSHISHYEVGEGLPSAPAGVRFQQGKTYVAVFNVALRVVYPSVHLDPSTCASFFGDAICTSPILMFSERSMIPQTKD